MAQKFKIYKPTKWIKQEPRIKDDGIYVPLAQYVEEGAESQYRLLIPKAIFIEAYNKWIKGEENV